MCMCTASAGRQVIVSARPMHLAGSAPLCALREHAVHIMNSLSPELQHVARRAQRSGIQAYQKARVMWDKNSSTAVYTEQVTSNEPGFPSTAECAKLASMSHQEEELARILEVRSSDDPVALVMSDRAARRTGAGATPGAGCQGGREELAEGAQGAPGVCGGAVETHHTAPV